MKLSKIVEQLEVVQAGLSDDTLQATVASVINALPDVVKEVSVEVAVDSPELLARASQLETDLAEANKKAEEAETALASLKAEIEAEKAEASAKALAGTRLEELKTLGVAFSEARASKVFDKLKAMSEEAFADYKEELLDAKAEMMKLEKPACADDDKKEEAEAGKSKPEEKDDKADKEEDKKDGGKDEKEEENVEVDKEDKAKAALNIEIPEGVENPYTLMWK